MATLNRRSAFGQPLTNIPYWGGKPKKLNDLLYGPAPGTYDPLLDQQLAAVNRGLSDTTADIGTQGARNTADYGIGVAQTNEQRAQQLQDLGFQQQQNTTGYGRSAADLAQQQQYGMQDIATARQRENENYSNALQSLQRAYTRLGHQQTQQARGMGIVSGGTYVAAANRRATNQAVDRQPIDLSHNRDLQDLATQEQRLQQGYTTQSGRLGEDLGTYNTQFGVNQGRINTAANEAITNLGLGLTRSSADLGTQLTRAQREASQYGIDTAAQRAYQSGYVAPGTSVAPGNIDLSALLALLGG